MSNVLSLELFISPDRAGSYFTLPFSMPENVETFQLRYRYDRHIEQPGQVPGGTFTARPQVNIIDLGLIGPDGEQIGASGSDKLEFTISETHATPGYRPTVLTPGEWQILVGAYKVAPEGVKVTYELTFTQKHLRLLKGDLHAHTLASDGVHTLEELAFKALRHGLDFLAVTDHNQFVSSDSLPRLPGVTLIPGVEWTHYQGHANFLGVERPYDEPFAANTPEEVRARFNSAHERGALIVINHPFDAGSGFKFDLNDLPFDLIEIWNGPMREDNLRAVGYWHSLLAAGKKIPAVGGSDYHRDTPFLFLGGPTTCVYALSPGRSEILSALRQGRAYITFAPNAPILRLTAGAAMLGDTVQWEDVRQLHIELGGLEAGDIVRVVTAGSDAPVFQAPDRGDFVLDYAMEKPGFARVEVLRTFIPGVPPMPALISNPIYFD